MPGTFVHLLLARGAANDLGRLDARAGVSRGVKRALALHGGYVLLGSVSPDLPYLDFGDGDAAGWANAMHYGGTLDYVRRGLAQLRREREASRGEADPRALAWLFGYVSHVVADTIVHPEVARLVGDYADNAVEHRRCELHQDAWAFYRREGRSLTRVEWFEDSGVCHCSEDGTREGNLLPAVAALWRTMLGGADDPAHAFPGEAKHPERQPEPEAWYRDYVRAIDAFAEEGGRFPVLLRGWLERQGLVYPEPEAVEARFVRRVAGEPRSGDIEAVWARAEEAIVEAWEDCARCLEAGEAFAHANVNLDTGEPVAAPERRNA